MATEILENEYKQVREENERYRQVNRQLKERLVPLNAEITATKNRIQEKLTIPGGIIKQQKKHQQDRDRIHILENELYQDTIRFNELMCSNAALRKNIAQLQQQKVRGHKIQAKLNRELTKQQSTMEEVMERLSKALNQKSKMETQMLEMIESIEAENLQFIKRRMELKTAIHHDVKLHSFMEKKLQKVTPLEEDEDSEKRTEQQQNQDGVQKVKMYQQAPSSLVVQDEQSNLIYINYITEQNSRLNLLKRAINRRKSDILLLEQENERREEQDAHELQELESELEKYGSLANSLEKQHAVVEERLDQLKTGMQYLYAEIMQTPISVTSDNLAHIISVVEERIIDLMMEANCRRYNDFPQKLLLPNYDLLPDIEASEENESRKSCIMLDQDCLIRWKIA